MCVEIVSHGISDSDEIESMFSSFERSKCHSPFDVRRLFCTNSARDKSVQSPNGCLVCSLFTHFQSRRMCVFHFFFAICCIILLCSTSRIVWLSYRLALPRIDCTSLCLNVNVCKHSNGSCEYAHRALIGIVAFQPRLIYTVCECQYVQYVLRKHSQSQSAAAATAAENEKKYMQYQLGYRFVTRAHSDLINGKKQIRKSRAIESSAIWITFAAPANVI